MIVYTPIALFLIGHSKSKVRMRTRGFSCQVMCADCTCCLGTEKFIGGSHYFIRNITSFDRKVWRSNRRVIIMDKCSVGLLQLLWVGFRFIFVIMPALLVKVPPVVAGRKHAAISKESQCSNGNENRYNI